MVLLRTFSKVYGLCGLRVGYALCGSDAFVTAVNQVRQPFFCNAAAQAAAVEALKHGDAVAAAGRARDHGPPGDRGRPRRAGHRPAASQANFAWFDLPVRTAGAGEVEAAIVKGLGERGVLVRAGAALGRAGALRVTYGTPQQNQRFLTRPARAAAVARRHGGGVRDHPAFCVHWSRFHVPLSLTKRTSYGLTAGVRMQVGSGTSAAWYWRFS